MIVIEEIWKDIVYKNIDYISVSNMGKVKRGNKLLNQTENHDGYLCVSLKSDAIKNPWRRVQVGVLVGMAFIDKPNNYEKFEINHKDYNRKNNNVDNIEWLTHADNVKYSVCNKPDLHNENNPNFGNRKLSKIYKDNPEYALEKQSRKGLKNGRCRKIRMYRDSKEQYEFDYIKECLQYLVDNKISNCKNAEVLRSQIRKCMINNTSYKGFMFEFLDKEDSI